MRAHAEAKAEEHVRATRRAEQAQKEMTERLEVAMEQAAAAKAQRTYCRLTASRDIVEARLDAMAEANSKLETIAAENAVASMYAKEAGTIEANRRSSPPRTTKMKSRAGGRRDDGRHGENRRRRCLKQE